MLSAALLLASFATGQTVDYVKEIKPLLAEKCYACHGSLQQKGELRVDTVKSLLEGGNQGPALNAGKGAASLLIERITGANGVPRMPPPSDGEPFSPQQVALFKRWIDQGAKAPADDKPESDPREHWAFRTPVAQVVPKNAYKHPIDAFLAADWAKQGLTPQKSADKGILLRRLYLDLIGLPPTREEIQAFEKDTNPDAYEKVVDRLLASPQYGERWGRHWMDILRYSDWWGLGQEVRNSSRHIWHWRDWIIESINADKGYDQMIREMLAGDELYPNDLDKVRGTGFLVRHYFRFNRSTWLDETIEHTSKAFLGLTFNCVKCHDHKYDPIDHVDYYRLRAFFEPYQVRLDVLPGQADLAVDGLPRVFDGTPDAVTYVHIRGDDRNPKKEKAIAPGLPKLFGAKLDIQPVTLPLEAHSPSVRPFILETHLKTAREKKDAAIKLVEQAKNEEELSLAQRGFKTAEAMIPALEARAAADRALRAKDPAFKELAQKAFVLEQTVLLLRAEEDLARAQIELAKLAPEKRGPVEKRKNQAEATLKATQAALAKPGIAYTPLIGARKTPESNLESEASLAKPYPTTSTGRRSALAHWIADAKNPLTARVAVNHLWARHFGKPLVATVFDFGRKGAKPTHPELLDYLALQFTESGWSMKKMHRLMVTSQAYRMSSSSEGAEQNVAKDGENRWLWRMNPQRMEAQVVRDSLLHLAGELDATMGGPSIPVAQETKRRSLYFVHSNNDQQKFLGLFDDASVRECYRRSESIVPQQALALSNSKVALGVTKTIADKLAPGVGEPFVRDAFSYLLATPPSDEELAACVEAIREWQAAGSTPARARSLLVGVLLNHNDFITIR